MFPAVWAHHGSERDPDGDDHGGEGGSMSRRRATAHAFGVISGFIIIPAGLAGALLTGTASAAPAPSSASPTTAPSPASPTATPSSSSPAPSPTSSSPTPSPSSTSPTPSPSSS